MLKMRRSANCTPESMSFIGIGNGTYLAGALAKRAAVVTPRRNIVELKKCQWMMCFEQELKRELKTLIVLVNVLKQW
ncbi:unnamed protein product [Ambrosiozyma monospora]|uniref:Unnamed protein product n=1 Tax=Ambrosiozyma monospora TaxID=43982 RepID=A0ACB5TB08_AMBMO|nr:unnamed protein product [Ambrosiozyma monospora]